jgi:hypothetical protein
MNYIVTILTTSSARDEVCVACEVHLVADLDRAHKIVSIVFAKILKQYMWKCGGALPESLEVYFSDAAVDKIVENEGFCNAPEGTCQKFVQENIERFVLYRIETSILDPSGVLIRIQRTSSAIKFEVSGDFGAYE